MHYIITSLVGAGMAVTGLLGLFIFGYVWLWILDRKKPKSIKEDLGGLIGAIFVGGIITAIVSFGSYGLGSLVL